MTLAGVVGDRRLALAKRLGWPDGRAGTLQEAGDLVGLTRERIRQLETRLQRRARVGVSVPVVTRALDLIGRNAPCSAERASRLLTEHGLAAQHIDPRALMQLASLLGLAPGFQVVEVDANREIVVQGKVPKAPALIRRLVADLKASARPFGFAHIELVREIVGRQRHSLAIEAESLLAMAAATPLSEGWYYLVTDSREPGIRLIEDMLAVAGGVLPASELQAGFERRIRWRKAGGHRASSGWYPSASAIASLCAQRPDLFRVDEHGTVAAAAPLDWHARLPDAERVMVEVLLEAPGHVLRRDEFEREVTARGVNSNTFSVYTSYSPFIRDLGGGLWGVRGVDADPVDVERLRRESLPRRRQIEEWRWLQGGEVRVQIRLSRVRSSMVIGIPSAVRAYLGGRDFRIVLPDGQDGGTMRVDESGAAWGFSRALLRLGAAEGDLLVADFSLVSGSVSLSLERGD
jgi:hypothetical protein